MIPNITEIVPDKYFGPTFPEGALKISKTTVTGVEMCALTPANLIIQGGCARGSMKVMRKILKPKGLPCTYR